jgi:quercetin dioxygenase-like cupin family protein
MQVRRGRLLAVCLTTGILALGGCKRGGEEAPEPREPEEAAEAEEAAEEPGEEAARAFIWTKDDADLEWGPCPEYMPEGCGLAVLQGDPTQNNADVFFRLAPGTTVSKHWHTSNERMVLISGELHVDYEGQDPVVLHPGTYAFGPGGLAHVASCAEGDECVLFIAFEEPVDAPSVEEAEAPGSDVEAFIATVDDVEWNPCPDFLPEGCGLAVLHGDPTQRNADVFFRLQPGTVAPHHWHTSAERMILVSGELEVDYDDQDPVVATVGTYAFGPAKLPHVASCRDGDDACVLFIAFEDAVDAVPVE